MKKSIVTGLVGMAIAGCLPENKTGNVAVNPSATGMPSATPVASSQPSSTPTARSSASAEPTPAQSSEVNAVETPPPSPTACPLIRADDPPRLDYPQDLAVSGDGKTLYVTSRPCSDLYDGYDIIQIGPSSEESQDCIHRLYVLKEGKLSAFPGQLMQTQGCYMSEIELAREENRLYISQLSTSKLLGFDTNTYQPNLDIFVSDYDLDQSVFPPAKIARSGPYRLYWDSSSQKIYFITSGSLSYSGSTGSIHTLLNNKPQSFMCGGAIFGFYDGYFYYPSAKTKNRVNLLERSCPFYSQNRSDYFLDFPNSVDYSDKNINPTGLRIDSKGDMYISDINNHAIWKYDFAKKEMYIFAGSTSQKAGYRDGQGSLAQFRYPTALDVDHAGNLYVADTGNKAIRKITPDGTVTTLYKEPNPSGR
jgi:DNA-binding beta-propeller fold protein YncE